MPDTENSKSMALPILDDFDSYEEYEALMNLWVLQTKVEKKAQPAIVAMSIPVSSEKYGDKLRKGLFKKIPPNTLNNNEGGVAEILMYLKELLGKEVRLCKILAFTNIIRYIKKPTQSMRDYCTNFEMLSGAPYANFFFL